MNTQTQNTNNDISTQTFVLRCPQQYCSPQSNNLLIITSNNPLTNRRGRRDKYGTRRILNAVTNR